MDNLQQYFKSNKAYVRDLEEGVPVGDNVRFEERWDALNRDRIKFRSQLKRRKKPLWKVVAFPVLASLALIFGVRFLMRPLAFNVYAAIAFCVAWGLVFMMFNLVTEFETIRNSPQATTVAVSIYSSIFNIGIGGGAFVGGMVINDYSLSAVGYVGGAIAVVAMLFALKRLLPAFKYRSAWAE